MMQLLGGETRRCRVIESGVGSCFMAVTVTLIEEAEERSRSVAGLGYSVAILS